MRALIDQGATHSIITKNAAQILQLNQTKSTLNVKGVGNKTIANRVNSVIVKTRPHFESDFKLQFNALVMESITSMLPEVKVMEVNVDSFKGLADPHYAKPGMIDLLISGAESETLT